MTHFSVIVLGPNVAEQLQPYHEYECTGIDDEYVVDVDVTDKERAFYEQSSLRSHYSTFAEYATAKWGDRYNPDTGRIIDHTNPKAKWDWWVIGGRWSNWLPVSEGVLGQLNIDAIRAHKAAEAQLEYRTVVPVNLPRPKRWAEYRQDYPTIELARQAFHNEPFVAALKSAGVLVADRFLCTEDEYVQRAARDAVVPHALVAEGQWADAGEMGWFATVPHPKNPDDWARFVNRVLTGMPDDTQFTVVDCHI